MRKKIVCVLFLSFTTFILRAYAEKEAPQIEKVEQATPEDSPVPVVLQQAPPEKTADQESAERKPAAKEEDYNSPISHSLETPHYDEYLKAIEKGAKTFAPLDE